jgi:O-antigen/teichoic acid export membrane protein
MILIRSLSKPQMGAWALFLAVTSIFETSKTNLLKNAHIRFVNTHEDHDEKAAIAASSFLINALLSLVFILVILFSADAIGRLFHMEKDLPDMLRWFIPGLVGMILFSHMEAIQQSFLDFKGPFAGYLVRQSVFFLAICIHAIWKIPFSLRDLAIYQSICIWLGAIVLLLSTRKYLKYRFNFSGKWLKEIFRYGGFIFSSGLVSNIFANLDQLMTGTFIADRSSVAYYNAAGRINQLVDIPSYAASDIMFPKVSQASAMEGNAKVRYLYERMVAILLSFTVPAALVVILFPGLVISLIAGKQYMAAALILQLYMITGILRPMQNQAANVLNSIGKPGLCLVINAISLIANLAINYTCFKIFGFYGAAIGTLITCLLGSTAWYFIMNKHIGSSLKNIIAYMIEFYKLLYRMATNLLSAKKTATPSQSTQKTIIASDENRTSDLNP